MYITSLAWASVFFPVGYGVSTVPFSSEILRFFVEILKGKSYGPAPFGKKNVSYSSMNPFLAQTLLFLSEHYAAAVKEIREAV